jgi:proline dehydrogenase
VSPSARPGVRALLERPLLGRVLTGLLAGRVVAGPDLDDALRVAGELVARGLRVALEHEPGPDGDATAELAELIDRVHAAGLADHCEITLPARRLGPDATERLVSRAGDVGLLAMVDGGTDVPGAGVVVPAGSPGAEARCRELSGGRVRLVQGRGAAAGLAFVRSLNVLMAADGRPEIAATDPRLIAIAGERAAWNGRTPDSWEHVMPYGISTDEQHRLLATGAVVRVALPSGPGAAAFVARRLGGRA